MVTTFAWTTLVVSLIAGSSQPATGSFPLRPLDLVNNADRYLQRTVEIEIVEPLAGPTTTEMLSRSEYGQVEIRIPEGVGKNLSLVPSTFRLEDPARYRRKFDRVIESPVRVRGEFLRDEELSKDYHRPAYIIRVAAIEALPAGLPEKVHSLAEIQSSPAHWDRKLIAYEGVYKSGFEISALDRDIWLDFAPKAEVVGRPPNRAGLSSNRVRVTGILFARPGSSYGHLGGYHFELFASRVEFLGAVHSQ
ncbi:MAG TPA: hypothetical protein VGS07_31180 [Thermoanaerobaculia bacterium]|nr:hypothetical protein [Thermoanaerobaculia bacterium]